MVHSFMRSTDIYRAPTLCQVLFLRSSENKAAPCPGGAHTPEGAQVVVGGCASRGRHTGARRALLPPGRAATPSPEPPRADPGPR